MKIKFYLLLISLITAIGSVWGQTPDDFEVDGLWYRQVGATNNVAVVLPDTVKYGLYSDHVTIPATVRFGLVTYDVTEIGANAFRRCHDLTGITIEGDKLETINGGAFYYCYNLTTITIPKSVTHIDSDFASNCYALESIIVESGSTSFRNHDNDGVLYTTSTHITPNRLVKYPAGRTESTYTIPAFVVELLYRSFQGSLNLPSITIPNTVRTILNSALEGAFFQSIEVESGHDRFVEIDGVLFNVDRTRLIQYPAGKEMPDGVYNVPATVTSIGQGSFAENSLREIHFPVPNTIIGIPTMAFRLSTFLETVTGLDNVITIWNQAFDECHSLKNFEFPEALTSIRLAAFQHCNNLFSGNVEIPKDITTIAELSFAGCLNIESFSIEEGNNAFFATDESGALFSATTPKRLIQYPPANKQDFYSLPDDVEIIDRDAAFHGAEIGTLTLSENLTTIGTRAFQYSKIDVLVFSSDIIPTTVTVGVFDYVSEDMIIRISSEDPAVIANYEALLADYSLSLKLSKYVVMLDYNDGVRSTKLLGSDYATSKLRVEPETPSRSAYDFLGWYDEKGDKWVAGTEVTSDITLTAQWSLTPPKPQYTVILESHIGVRLEGNNT